jgi:hypothetical protein
MITKKQFTLLFCVFLFTVVAFQAQPAEALPFDNEYTNVTILAGDYEEYYIALTSGEEISGYFETSVDTDGLDFFICDAANFAIWDGGGSATGYETVLNYHTNGYTFTVPYSATWYIVHSNVPGSTSVTVDIAIDVNGDNTPVYSSSDYTYTRYGITLEDDEYHFLSYSFSAGTVVGGHFSTFFSTDGLDFFICDEANFDDWELGFSATGYSIETDMHTSTIDDYTIPTTGTWYFVFFAESEVDALTFSVGINVDTSGVGGGGAIDMTGISAIGLIAGLLIIGILCCVCRSKKKDPEVAPPSVDYYRAPPSTPRPTETVREREIVRDRVLVICPYCGSKNEQGITTCKNCDAEL